jgi:hypothetical protein
MGHSILAAAGTGLLAAALAQAQVALVRAPEGGMQPQAAVDAHGTLHLVYLKGEPGAADIFYVRRAPGAQAFSAPLRVNSQPGSAIPAGTIRGAQIAVGKAGRVSVAWNGSRAAEPKAPGGNTPMLYSRLDDAGTAFEPQRNLLDFAGILDGGGSVAADSAGHVWVAFHAGDGSGEAKRKVWVTESRDEGKTFSRPVPATNQPTGACGCCGMKALADGRGGVYLLYRSAIEGVDRDMYLVAGGRAQLVDRWRLNACPMSSASLALDGSRVLAAWETAQQVYFAEIDPNGAAPAARIAAPGEPGKRKHPALAHNARGETLLAWTEGTGWNKGGALAWQVYGKDGRPTAEKGRADGVPVWSLATAAAGPDGKFTIVY